MGKNIKNEFEYKRLKQLLNELPIDRQEVFASMMIDKTDKKILSVPEFSEIIGTPETTIRRWLREGKLKGTRIGRKWLIPITEAEKIINPPDKE